MEAAHHLKRRGQAHSFSFFQPFQSGLQQASASLAHHACRNLTALKNPLAPLVQRMFGMKYLWLAGLRRCMPATEK